MEPVSNAILSLNPVLINEKKTGIKDLPVDMIVNIFSYLKINDLKNVQFLDKEFYKIVNRDEGLQLNIKTISRREIGLFVRGKFQKGTSILTDGKMTICTSIGTFKNGLFSEGTKNYHNGFEESGTYENSLLFQGTRKLPNGEKLAGTFGLIKNEDKCFQHELIEGTKSYKGTTWTGKFELIKKDNIYHHALRKGKKTCNEMTWEGEFTLIKKGKVYLNELIEGTIIKTYNEIIWEGKVVNGILQEHGKVTYPDGRIETNKFVKDVLMK